MRAGNFALYVGNYTIPQLCKKFEKRGGRIPPYVSKLLLQIPDVPTAKKARPIVLQHFQIGTLFKSPGKPSSWEDALGRMTLSGSARLRPEVALTYLAAVSETNMAPEDRYVLAMQPINGQIFDLRRYGDGSFELNVLPIGLETESLHADMWAIADSGLDWSPLHGDVPRLDVPVWVPSGELLGLLFTALVDVSVDLLTSDRGPDAIKEGVESGYLRLTDGTDHDLGPIGYDGKYYGLTPLGREMAMHARRRLIQEDVMSRF